jgi:hypothetical protein
LFLLFPTGYVRSRRWRPAAWLAGGAFALAAGALITSTSLRAHPYVSARQVTGLNAGMYAGLVLLAIHVLTLKSPVAVAGSTLVAAALFSPLRSRVQQLVDRRFNRARYDADQMVAMFAVRLKDTADLDAVQSDLTSVIQRALEPAHVSLWTKNRG